MNDDLDSTTKQEALKYHSRGGNPGKNFNHANKTFIYPV